MNPPKNSGPIRSSDFDHKPLEIDFFPDFPKARNFDSPTFFNPNNFSPPSTTSTVQYQTSIQSHGPVPTQPPPSTNSNVPPPVNLRAQKDNFGSVFDKDVRLNLSLCNFSSVRIYLGNENYFRTPGRVAHIQTTTTDTIPPMMISPVLKNRLVNFNNLVITCLIAIYTRQIMAIHQRIHHQVDHVTLILRIIPILITTVEWNREWFVIQIKIRVNHHLQHNHPPKIRLISHQMRNLVEVKIFNTQINATPIRNHFKNNLSTSGTGRIQNVSILITLNYF